MQGDQPPNPLQLGQTLYEVLDLTILGTPKGAGAARYNRVTYNSQGGTTADPLDTVPQDTVLDLTADTDVQAAVQKVHLLTKTELWMIGSSGDKATSQTFSVDGAGLTHVVGIDPQQTGTTAHLQLLGSDSSGVFLRSMDCASGNLTEPLRLSAIEGKPAGAVLVRRQREAHVVVAAVSGQQLTLYDLGQGVLGPDPKVPSTIPSVALGTICDGGVVSMTAASLLDSTADQQVAVVRPDSDSKAQLAVAGWQTNGTWVSLATATPDLTFAKPDKSDNPVFRLAAGDVIAGGVQQLVLGYAATFTDSADSVTYSGCAALMLYELRAAKDGNSPSLQFCDHYVASRYDGADPLALASVDLHLAAGLFGEVLTEHRTDTPGSGDAEGVLGVVVIGCGAGMKEIIEGKAPITAGLVPVDRNHKTFPPYSGKPGTLQQPSVLMTLDYRATGFAAVPSDTTGRSVVLGPPTASTTSRESAGGQLLAVIKSPPYEKAKTSTVPSLVYGTSTTVTTGTTVSCNKQWMFTNDTGQSLGVQQQTLQDNVSHAYGYGFDKTKDSSTATSVHVMSQTTNNDMIAVYGMDYYVWTYPVYRKSCNQGKPDGTMAVLFPASPAPEQQLSPAAGSPWMGYVPRSAPGVLLSYVDTRRDGYDPQRLLFSLESYPVSEETGQTTVVYDKTSMNHETLNKSYTVHNTASTSKHFAVGTTLLQYVPINFGLNLTETDSYSQTTVNTTAVTTNTDLTVTIQSGAVSSSDFDYQVTPYIYYHSALGCVMVDYDVQLSGKGWDGYYKTPQPLLIPLQPSAQDPLLKGFSRSLSFTDTTDGTIVSVEIFNNGLQQIDDVFCEFYRGLPKRSGNTLVPDGPVVAEKHLSPLAALARGTVELTMALKEKDVVTVKVYAKGLAPLGQVCWAIYPASAYADWKPPA
ncbi:hypothetical protein [Streptomyces sp. YIM 98790]|uniref:hypothetical protein n=1 Tax=Streptomyces sp. YIM 98790 TaxID=2689077 RepID=UPI00140792F9|nr:hypothetical protein [Streptomyces sp. YIM 98790]